MKRNEHIIVYQASFVSWVAFQSYDLHCHCAFSCVCVLFPDMFLSCSRAQYELSPSHGEPQCRSSAVRRSQADTSPRLGSRGVSARHAPGRSANTRCVRRNTPVPPPTKQTRRPPPLGARANLWRRLAHLITLPANSIGRNRSRRGCFCEWQSL